MTCEEIREKLSEYIDGECEAAAEVKEHLEACPECRKEYEKLLSLSASFKDFVEAPEKSLADSVVSVIRREKMRKTPFFVRHIGLAASLLVILFLAVYSRFFPYDTKESADIAVEAETLEATVTDIKNSATLKGDFHFAIAEDSASFVEEAEEEALPEAPMATAPLKSESVLDVSNESVVYSEKDGYSDTYLEYVFLSNTSALFDTLSLEFETEKVDETTFIVKTLDLDRVKEIVGTFAEVYEKDGAVVVVIKN